MNFSVLFIVLVLTLQSFVSSKTCSASRGAIEGLEPKPLWEYFYQISCIPRCSNKEEAVRQKVVEEYAKKYNFPYKVDEVGNIVLKVPATRGYESKPIIVLQTHMDMVCEKNTGVDHDFEKDPIQLARDSSKNWMIPSKKTTLGADDGLGMSHALLLATDPNVVHGPLELLFTVGEEIGLVGAFALKPDFLSGDFLINIDSVIEGEITIGSAGGIDVVSTLISEFETSPSFHKKYSLKVENLVGGHSGVDINKNRANAIKVLTRVWNFISKGNEEWFKVMEFKSGSKSNAIPREAELILSMDPRLELKLKAEVDKIMKLIQAEFKTPEPNMSYSLKRLDSKVVNKVFTKQTAERLKNVLQIYPTGVVAMSPDLPDLVETSLNLAVIQMKNGNVEISSSIRSSVQSAMNNTVVTVQNLIELAGGSTKTIGAYPGWKPDLDAPLLKLAQSAYKELFNKDVRVAAIHAGLETGVIGSKFPKMQMISVGSQVEGPHSPDERILISSVPKSYALVAKTLEKLAK